MMRGLQFREDRISEKVRRSFAKIAAGLVLVSTIGCASRPLIPDTRSSSYYSTPARVRDMHNHLDDPAAGRVTVHGIEVRVIDLVLPLQDMIRRSRTRLYVEQDGAPTVSDSITRGARQAVFAEDITVERYERRDEGVLSQSGLARFGFFPPIHSDGQPVQESSMQVVHRIGGQEFSRRFPAEDFVFLVENSNNGRPFEGITILNQGAFGRYSCFAVATVGGRPIGRISEGLLAMAITYDHQRGEATGGIVVLREP